MSVKFLHRLITALFLFLVITPAHSSDLVTSMRGDLGTNPTGWHRQWCAHYLRVVLDRLGYHEAARHTDNRAASFLRLKHTRPCVGCIAVYGHHVGVVSGFEHGWPILISGNSTGRRVAEGVYPRHPLAYVEAN